MEKAEVRIEGISPLLMHRFPVAEQDPQSKSRNIKKNKDNVEDSLYRDEDGNLVQPSTHLIGALKRAGVKFQIPGQGKTTYKNVVGSGAVIIEPDMIPHEIQEWKVNRMPVVVQRARIVRERPVLPNWALNFSIEYDEDEISKSTLKELLDYAGRRAGIGDFRPDKGGSFGRFIVTKFN
jgi:hypothetical protein